MACEAEQSAVESAMARVQELQEKCAGLSAVDLDFMACQIELINAEGELSAAIERLRECRTKVSVRIAEGFVTFLRVHELGSGIGGGNTNFLDAEAVFRLNSDSKRIYGFQMRSDKFLPARQGMLSLLRDAMLHNLQVRIDYLEAVNQASTNSFAIRIAVLKPLPITKPPADVFAPV